MSPAELKAAFREGRPVFGTCVVSCSPRWPETVAQLGLDFVFIDTEHIPIGRESAAWMCRTYRALGLPPLLRIPEPDPYLACMAYDAGAVGVVAPYVETVEQVRALVGAAKRRPLKGIRLDAHLAEAEPLEPELDAYLAEKSRENLLIVNIESTSALDNLDSLLGVPGVDAALIGPHDLTCSLGIPEQYQHERFEQAVHTVITTARRHGIGAGIHFWNHTEQEAAWVRAGLNLLIHSSDLRLFAEGVTRELAEIQRQVDPDGTSTDTGKPTIVI